jgi:uncharacterized protein (TIGR03643 family)
MFLIFLLLFGSSQKEGERFQDKTVESKKNYLHRQQFPNPEGYDIHRMAPLSESDIDRIIAMAWEDRTPFDAIEVQFGLTHGQVQDLMRKELSAAGYTRWRKRIHAGIGQKHQQRRSEDIRRFKCDRQRAITGNRISKR